jgi:4-hydroxybenzoate polyprenyltransferase
VNTSNPPVTHDPAMPEGSVSGHPGQIAGLLGACHPGPTVAVTTLITALAVAAHQNLSGCVLVALAVLAGQLSVGWSNDAVDAARDATVGRQAKPVVGGSVRAERVRNAALVALTVCVPLSLAYDPLAGAVHLLGVAAAWWYNLRLKSTVLSWLPYAIGFACLPVFVALGLPGGPWPVWWVVVAAALLGIGAHLANVLPDIDADLATGVRGWPQRLGPDRVRLLLPVPLVAATVLLVVGRTAVLGGVAVASAVLVSAGASALGSRRPRLPFLAAILVAAVDVGLLLWQGTSLT